MSGFSPPPVDVLAPEGWAHSEGGEIAEGKPQWCKGNAAYFMHSRELQAHDVLRTKVVKVGGIACVGFAAESYDVEKHGETDKSTAWVYLSNGTTVIYSDISRDGEEHIHRNHLNNYIPKTLPYDLALRISKDGNVPQVQFNDDAVWHDFTPDRAAVKAERETQEERTQRKKERKKEEGEKERRKDTHAGPWFPFLWLAEGDRLSDHCVHRPKPTKSAGKTSKAPAAAPAAAAPAAAASAAASVGGAGAAVDGKDNAESAPPPQ